MIGAMTVKCSQVRAFGRLLQKGVALAMGATVFVAMSTTISGCRGGDATRPSSELAPVPAKMSDPNAMNAKLRIAGPLRGPGFPSAGPWVSFYGNASQMQDLERVAQTYRIINIDADPGAGNFSDAQLAVLRGGGRNRVLSYFNIGACEHYRSYWKSVPEGFVSCAANTRAQRGSYEGYPDETWMDPSSVEYQRLIVEHVAPRLAARVDGFYLDNLEILEHSATTSNGPCSAACRQGGLDLVRKLRERFPNHLIVMQNATGEVTRKGVTGGIAFPLLLDGVAHEEVYAPDFDETAEEQLLGWSSLSLSTAAGRSLWIGIEDYVGTCANRQQAHAAMEKARRRGFSGYASDESAGQKVVCFW